MTDKQPKTAPPPENDVREADTPDEVEEWTVGDPPFDDDDDGYGPPWPKGGPKTEEELADIAYLDELRAGVGETKPVGLPLACIVKILDCEDVPKANDAYSMIRVEGAGGRIWRLCVFRECAVPGATALFVSDEAALPLDDRFRNPCVCSVRERVFKFGHGVKERRLLPHVKRHIYRHNCGVVYPLDDFGELRRQKLGVNVASLLHIDDAGELKARQSMPLRDLSLPRPTQRAAVVLKRLRQLTDGQRRG